MARQPRQQKIDIYGGFTPSNIDSGQQAKMRALAGLGETVADLGVAIAKPAIVAERVKEAKIASAEAGTIDPETGELRGPAKELSAFSWGAAQANAVARNTYESNVSVEMNNIVDSAATEFPDDIVGYQNKVESAMKGLIGAMPEEYRGQAQNLYARLNNPTSIKIADNERKKTLAVANTEIRQAATVAEKGLSNAAFAGDVASTADFATEYAVSLQRLVDQGDMTTDRQAELLTAQDERIIVQGKLGEVDRAIRAEGRTPEQQIEDGRAIVEALRENPDADLSAEKNQELITKLNAAVASKAVAYSKEKATLTVEEQNIKADYNTSVKLSTKTPSELISEAYDLQARGILSPAERSSYEVEIQKTSVAEITKNRDIADVSNLVSGATQPTDRVVVATQKSVDDYYELTEPRTPLDPDLRSTVQAKIAAKTGYIPTQVRTEIRNSLRSNDPAKIEYAVETIDRIQSIAGIGEQAFNAQEVAFADQVMDAMNYMSMEKAIENANNITASDRPERRAMAETRANQIKEDKDTFADAYRGEIISEFKGTFTWESDFIKNNPSLPLMVKDYGKLVENLYKSGTVDIESAKAKAMKLINANWKDGEFGLMKYPPNQFEAYKLPSTDDTTYIRDQLKSELLEQGLDVPRENIYLESDEETARTASSGKPTYRVTVELDDGTINAVTFVRKDGQTSPRYYPDVEAGTKVQEENNRLAGEKALYPYGKLKKQTYTTLDKNTEAALGNILASSNSPFAIQGRSIAAAVEAPSKVTPSLVKKILEATGVPFAIGEIDDAYEYVKSSVQQASDNYVASLQKNKGQGMIRPDGSTKSKKGYLGPIDRDDGETMTEFSIGVQIDGTEMNVPSMVPTLTEAEVEALRTLPEDKEVPIAIQRKAAAHARKRISQGLNPFYQDGE